MVTIYWSYGIFIDILKELDGNKNHSMLQKTNVLGQVFCASKRPRIRDWSRTYFSYRFTVDDNAKSG